MESKWSEENLRKIIKDSRSYANVLNKLGLKGGGSYTTLKKYIKKYNIDISHFKFQGWNSGLQGTEETSIYPIESILLNSDTYYSTTSLKNRLFILGLKERKCEKCGCGEVWQGDKLTLELHHINGNRTDNRLENLQILCPNCHSQTKTFRVRKKYNGKKRRNEDKISTNVCKNCGKEYKGKRNSKFCSLDCLYEYRAKKINSAKKETKITKEKLLELINKYNNNKTKIAIELNIHRCTLRNYLIENGLSEYINYKK